MRLEIIKIGNSKGLRIPKAVLDQCHLKNVVNLTIEDCRLIITPCEDIRKGWTEQFDLMAEQGDDSLLDISTISHAWDEDEWQW